jgi:hypothetical protein
MNALRWIAGILKWLGLASVSFGVLETVWAAAVLIQPPENDLFTRFAVASAVGGMFFVVAGSGLVLLSRPLYARMPELKERHPRWLLFLAALLAVYGVGSIGLATVLAGRTEELAGVVFGLVTYCMFVGVGSLIAAWGLKRASEAD